MEGIYIMTSVTYQLEGIDDGGRYFSRSLEITDSEGLFSALINYEGLKIATNYYHTKEEALKELVSDLRKRGFIKIRARLNYIRGRYLVEERPWIYFPD